MEEFAGSNRVESQPLKARNLPKNSGQELNIELSRNGCEATAGLANSGNE
jgi:hypothetical protein